MAAGKHGTDRPRAMEIPAHRKLSSLPEHAILLPMKKIVHTADWHLGARLGSRPRLPEQLRFLDWLCAALAAESLRADLLVVAGDVFDTGAPSNEALAAYYGFLRRVDAENLARRVLVLGGNHDSPALLSAPKPVLESVRAVVVPEGADAPEDIASSEAFAFDCADGGTLAVAAVPFLRLAQLANAARLAGVPDDSPPAARLAAGFRAHCETAARAARAKAPPGVPLLLTGHASFSGAVPSDAVSERARRPVGGLDELPPALLPPADYVALGHYHRAQAIPGLPHARYAGAPIPMSFSEAGQDKGVLLVELDAPPAAPRVRLLPYRDTQPLWRFRGSAAAVETALRARLAEDPDSTAWIEATLTEGDADPVAFRRALCDLVKDRAVTLMVVQDARPAAPRHALAVAAGSDLSSLTPLDLARRRLEAMHLDPAQIQSYLDLLSAALDPSLP